MQVLQVRIYQVERLLNQYNAIEFQKLFHLRHRTNSKHIQFTFTCYIRTEPDIEYKTRMLNNNLITVE